VTEAEIKASILDALQPINDPDAKTVKELMGLMGMGRYRVMETMSRMITDGKVVRTTVTRQNACGVNVPTPAYKFLK